MHNDRPSDIRKSAVVVIDLANDFVYPGGVIADAGGPQYQARAQAIIPVIRRLLDAAHRIGAPTSSQTIAYTRRNQRVPGRASKAASQRGDCGGGWEPGMTH